MKLCNGWPSTTYEYRTPLHLIEESSVLVCGKKFPKSTVKNVSDITFGNEIGDGAFGKVYKGFLHLSKHERYVLFVIYESKIKVTQLLYNDC